MVDLNAILAIDKDVEETKDVIGGGGYIKESGLYLVKINHAFFEESKGGATGVNLSIQHKDKTEMNTTVYITSGLAKGQKNYYVNQKGNKVLLPGYVTMDEICLAASGKPMAQSTLSTKAVEVYDFTAGKKVSKQVQVLDALIGAIVNLGITKNLVNKWKDGAPTAETTDRNEISKAFNKDRQTSKEAAAGEPATFVDKWVAKHEGVTKDERTIKDGAVSAHAAAATPAVSADNTEGLFD